MKRHRQILIFLIFGVGLPLVFLSAQLKVDVGDIDAYFAVLARNASFEARRQHPTDRDADANSTLSNSHRLQSATRTTGSVKNVSRVKRQYASTLREGEIRFANEIIRKQVLELVHITKTGGTAAEVAAGRVNIKWGVCHWHGHVGYGRGCGRPDWNRPRRLRHEVALRNDTPIPNFKGEPWHTPPSWFVYNPYRGSNTFTIVRNPYERVISEFYCPYFGYFRQNVVKPDQVLFGRQYGRLDPRIPRNRLKEYAGDDKNQEEDLSESDLRPRRGTPGMYLNGYNRRKREELPIEETHPPRAVREMMTRSNERIHGNNLNWPPEDLAQNQHPHRRLENLASKQSEADDNNELSKNTATHNEVDESQLLREINNIRKDDQGFPTVNRPRNENRRGRLKKNVTRTPLPPPTVLMFNRWIRRAVKYVNNPFSGHMLPQSYYVYDEINGTEHKVVDHVIKYESLHQQFADLMNKYGLDHVRLQPRKRRARDFGGKPHFNVSDMDPHTICFINERYAKDFEHFGYDRIEVDCDKLSALNETYDFEQNLTAVDNQTNV